MILLMQLRVIATTLMSSVGGASGPLYGAFFLQGSHATAHKAELGLTDLTSAIEAGYRGVVQLGKASVGDKTMVDTLAAAVRSLRVSCTHYEVLPEALKACRNAARTAAEGTIPMFARKGRASYLGERSAGVQDPGAPPPPCFSTFSRRLAEAPLPLTHLLLMKYILAFDQGTTSSRAIRLRPRRRHQGGRAKGIQTVLPPARLGGARRQ